MRVKPNEKPTELSYIDLLAGLQNDVTSDTTMPKATQKSALAKIEELQIMLEAYSA